MRSDSVQWLLALWGLSEVALGIATRRRARGKPSRDRGSMVVLFVAFTIGAMAANFASQWHRAPIALPLGPVPVLLLIAGVALRWWAILTLGRHFTLSVVVGGDQRIVRSGPYRVLRHPSYAGILLILIGAGLAFRDWLSLIALLAAAIPALAYRIVVEERAMRAEFGAAWDDYAAHTWRVMPGVV
jgi:protein-S-isoprenylcysteine O-methyltransferase